MSGHYTIKSILLGNMGSPRGAVLQGPKGGTTFINFSTFYAITQRYEQITGRCRADLIGQISYKNNRVDKDWMWDDNNSDSSYVTLVERTDNQGMFFTRHREPRRIKKKLAKYTAAQIDKIANNFEL